MPKTLSKYLQIAVLILAGESVFLLPFVIVRIFRPTFMEIFHINNLEIGSAFSLYGLVAMISYVCGGPLADTFSSKKLMVVSLWATALGGIFMSQIPDVRSLILIYGYWGFTTIFLFWAPFIKLTREWGGNEDQGKAFGLLDSGRGLFAAILASTTVYLFSQIIKVDDSLSFEQKKEAFTVIVWIFTGIVFLASFLVLFLLPNNRQKTSANHQFEWKHLKNAIKIPAIWAQSIIILCAYVGFKSTDILSLYGKEVFNLNDIQSANIGTISFWVRPLAALTAGYIADKVSTSKLVLWNFVIAFIGSCSLAYFASENTTIIIMFMNIIFLSIGVYALRGVYFALFEEAKIPMVFMGISVGIVSFLGYTPDIFMGPVIGWALDSFPGPLGHQYLFTGISVVMLIGAFASVVFQFYNKKAKFVQEYQLF